MSQTEVVGIAGLTEKVQKLKQKLRGLSLDELRSTARSLMERRRAGDESAELRANVLATSGEAIRRVTGIWPAQPAWWAGAAMALGVAASVRGQRDRAHALAMAACWFGSSGASTHLITLDDDSARRNFEFLHPVVAALGCDIGLVLPTSGDIERRCAYMAMITVGSYAELASDYLRDNLRDRRAELVQRDLNAAVVEDVQTILVDLAIGTVFISAPANRSMTDNPLEDMGVAASLQHGADYQRHPEVGAIVFSTHGIDAIKRACGWGDIVSVDAINAAQGIERAILRREGLSADECQTLADITVQGFVRLYRSLTGSSAHRVDPADMLTEIYGLRSIDADPFWSKMFRKTKRVASPQYIATEHVVDEQRSATYQLRAKIRDETRMRQLIQSLSTQVIPEERLDALGMPAALELARQTWLTVVDIHWWQHLGRLRFLQRNMYGLYGATRDIPVSFRRDTDLLSAVSRRRAHESATQHLLASFGGADPGE